VAQPLAKFESDFSAPISEQPFTSSLDAAATRMELAFSRLEGAVANSRAKHHSLNADHEKLNHLLSEADEEIIRLRQAITTVSARLDHTIGVLEAMEE
jgi:chromosome segregation ATPase